MILMSLPLQFQELQISLVDDIVAWQNRPRTSVCLITWMDCIVFKVRENSKVINKTMYIALGLRRHGNKEVLGLKIL